MKALGIRCSDCNEELGAVSFDGLIQVRPIRSSKCKKYKPNTYRTCYATTNSEDESIFLFAPGEQADVARRIETESEPKTFHWIDCTCESDPLGRCVVHPKSNAEVESNHA